MGLIVTAGAIAGILAFLGLAVLTLLVFTQARQLRRLREEGHETKRFGAAASASGMRAAFSDAFDEDVPTAAERASGAERAELADPPPRRRDRTRRSQPWGLRRIFPRGLADPRLASFVVVVVVALGGAGLILSLGGGGGEAATRTVRAETSQAPPSAPVVIPSDVSVSVLNATTVGGLGGVVGEELRARGFDVGEPQNASRQDLATTEVQYVVTEKAAGDAVARALGIGGARPVGADAAAQMPEGADVAVLVGADRAQ